MNTGSAPSRLSARVQEVRPCPTPNMAAVTRKLKELDRDVVKLSMGEPDFDTKNFTKEASVTAIRSNETKYTEVSGTTTFYAALS